MKSLKDLLQQSKQKSYMLGNVFAEGDWVQNNLGEVGKIHRRGVNYVIAVTEEGKMFRAWVKDIKEYYNDTEENMGISDKEKVQRFINKNKRKKTNDD
jgi:hypothetical protein